MTTPRLGLPQLGYGIGLRSAHVSRILRETCACDWFEIISENYLDCHGWRRYALDQIAERYPIVMHGVAMSIGSSSPLDFAYLAQLKQLARDTRARWVSDHLCWTGVANQTTHDLLPMPLTEDSLQHVIARIHIVQDVLEQPLIIENPSSYASFKTDTLSEWDFLARMAEATQCGLLLDINNVYVSSVNHGFDAYRYIDNIPLHHMIQIHLAGHRNYGSHLLDTHDGPVCDSVWNLYHHAIRRFGSVSTLLEWDDSIPELEVLEAEILKAKQWALAPIRSANTRPFETVTKEFSPAQNMNAYPALAGAQFDMQAETQ